MKEPRWLGEPLARAIHSEQLALYGGPAGLRDSGLLQSALNRPYNRWVYETVDLADLAASYAYGVARYHPFVDGNKRAALLFCTTFLGLNAIDFDVPGPEAVVAMLKLAADEIDESGLARWIRDRSPPGTFP